MRNPMKIVVLVLVLSFVIPRPALAITPFEPFDKHLADLEEALGTVIGELDTAIAGFADSKKVRKNLGKAKVDLTKARETLRVVLTKKSNSAEFPLFLKIMAALIKKGLGRVDKAFKGSGYDPVLCDFVCDWGALILAPLFALMIAALSMSFVLITSRGHERKHIKAAKKMNAALLLLGMSGGLFVPAVFAWGADTKKGVGSLVGALKLSIVLILLISSYQD